MKKLTTKGLTRLQMRGYSIVPLLTPFDRSGKVDVKSLEKVIEHIIAGGCQGLMVCGTTGEFASMSVAQRVQVVREAARIGKGRAVIFGGIGDTCLEHSLTLAREFLAAGADAVVGNLPSYYPLTTEMMERYFTRLADGIDGPVYLYNIPQTTRQSIPLELIERLSHHPRIVGLKDSEPDAARQEQVCRMFAGREDFAVFCGSIAFSSRAMRSGADGIVPGAGNFAPQLARQLMDKLVSGDVAAGDAAQQRMDAVNATYQKGRTISQLFCALKAIMEIKGLCARHMLPPLTDATDAEVAQIKAALTEIGA
jgi:4-hydroxy-tetrahydrodipicolinate synthase